MIHRRGLLSGIGAVASLCWLPHPARLCAQEKAALPNSFPQTDPQRAFEIVGAAHVDLEKVTTLLRENRSLAKASWDWGFGDWESAIGAASHMGRRDIIELLLGHGAAPTIFTFAALDQVDVVRAICQGNANIQKSLGPHGITLYKHAAIGKANRVIEYLNQLGEANVPQTDAPLSKEQMSVYIGNYDFGHGPKDAFEVGMGTTSPNLGLRRTGGTYRFMAHLGKHSFTIFGCPQVEIEFDVVDGSAMTLQVKNGGIDIVATRI